MSANFKTKEKSLLFYYLTFNFKAIHIKFDSSLVGFYSA